MSTENFEIVKEGEAEILFPKGNHVFYNPPQVVNRDVTIAVISEFTKAKLAEKCVDAVDFSRDDKYIVNCEDDDDTNVKKETVYKGERYEDGITILEALSATGLRSVRFAKELSGVKSVIANDLSEAAVKNIQRNIDHNGVQETVKANHGDATLLMYQSKAKKDQFDVVDVDPFGTASPFIDAAVQAVADKGLLCVTCTDMAVLAGSNAHACYAKYNSIALKTKACKEQALRVLLFAISSAAAKHQKYIVPLISISVDFYIRVFVQVFKGKNQANLSASQQIYLYRCGSCTSFHPHRLANAVTKGNTQTLVPSFAPEFLNAGRCNYCGNNVKIGGPYWGDSLHSVDFVNKVLSSVKNFSSKYASSERLIGILSMISEELTDVPFYYVTSDLSGTLRCDTPSSDIIRSALMNSGFRVSAFHDAVNSIKTDAPPAYIWDIMRTFVDIEKKDTLKKRLKKLPECHAARKILGQPIASEKIDLTLRKDCKPLSVKQNIVRYPELPPFWGPKSKAVVNSDGTTKAAMNEKSKKNQGKFAKKRKAKQHLNKGHGDNPVKVMRNEDTKDS